MHPLLTFTTGLIAGIAGIRALKKAQDSQLARKKLEAAETGLRRATVSGLEALERSSASLRGKLTVVPEAPAAEVAAPASVPAKPAPRPRSRRTTKAAKPAVPPTTAE